MKITLRQVNKDFVYTVTDKKLNELQQIKDAIKELAQKFAELPEIGRFKPIKVAIDKPVAGSRIKTASMVIEPSVNPNDYRTRVLTFRTNLPGNDTVTNEISPAIGNKFSIESTLKNPKLSKLFEKFIKDSEDILC